MTNHSQGHFYVGTLSDGRFVAAAASEPYFCFRADTEEAVIAKAKKALSFYCQAKGADGNVRISQEAVTVTALRSNGRRSMNELLEAA